jgi:hypothetical protein
MRLRHDHKQNHPKKKTVEERVEKPVDELDFLKGGTVPKKPKYERGVPVPLRWTHRRTMREPIYTDGQIEEAKRTLEETGFGEWPGPQNLDTVWDRFLIDGPKYDRWKLYRVYRVKRGDAGFYKTVSDLTRLGHNPNIKRLYHGTSETSITGIVLKGLLQGNQGMFGSGIYLAPDIHKAAVYSGYDMKFIFTVEAVLGNVKTMDKADHDGDGNSLWVDGYHSVSGKAGHTVSHGDQTLARDEYCVYFRDQVRILSLACYRLVSPVKQPGNRA